MQYYPNNTVARYTTKLDNTIELEGAWEVGLVEISVPTVIANVVRDECFLDIVTAGQHMGKLVLPPTNVKRLHRLFALIDDEQRKQLSYGLMGRTDEEKNANIPVQFYLEGDNVSMKLRNDVYGQVSVMFSKSLADMLGFDDRINYFENTTTATRPPYISPPLVVRSVYVYCDLLEHVLVGDTKAPLLRIVNKPHRPFGSSGNVHNIMNPILHVPLQKKSFDTVEISLMTDMGSLVPFIDGKSFVVLELRRTVHPYFSL